MSGEERQCQWCESYRENSDGKQTLEHGTCRRYPPVEFPGTRQNMLSGQPEAVFVSRFPTVPKTWTCREFQSAGDLPVVKGETAPDTSVLCHACHASLTVQSFIAGRCTKCGEPVLKGVPR